MKKIKFLLILFVNFGFAQLNLPYVNNFNSTISDENWTHYATLGIDNWERGVASGNQNQNDFSWETKLSGTPTTNSIMYLESPSFDLTNANLPYVISFKQKSNINSGNFYLEYSIDDGTNWSLLNTTTTLKKNWQFSSGFTLSSSSNSTSKICALNLSFLQGNSNVKFRFKFKTNNYCSGYGVIIDDFSISTESYNLYPININNFEVSPLCTNLNLKYDLIFDNQYTQNYSLTHEYYISSDTILDNSDTLLHTQNTSIGFSFNNHQVALNIPNNLLPGQYYILIKLDSANGISESNENDNIGYSSLIIRPIFNLPYTTDFEVNDENWKVNFEGNSNISSVWLRNSGTRHHIEKSHSGNAAWHTGNTIIDHPEYTFQSVESPYFDLSSAIEPLIVNFWYKNEYPGGVNYYDNVYKVYYTINCGANWEELLTIPENTSDEWESITIPLNSNISSNSNIKFKISYHSNYLKPEGIIFDDFYIGPNKPDLSLEKIFSNKRFTSSNTSTDILKYELRNSGENLSQNSSIKFYWSSDNTYDNSDVFLGEQILTNLDGYDYGEWFYFNYTKPTTTLGDFYIIYKIDENNLIDELRENNNEGSIPIQQLATFNFPYYNDFETSGNDWSHESTLGQDEWNYGTPQGIKLNSAFSGNKAWISNAAGNQVTSMSRMHLYTPAFNLSNSTNPVLEFDMLLDNYGGCNCFELTLNMSYSTDNGATWIVLTPQNDSYSKWNHIMSYNDVTATDQNQTLIYTKKMFASSEVGFSNYKHYNSRDIDRNTKYIINIPQLKDETNIRFRFNLSTFLNDGSSSNPGILEGALIDNFQIREAEIDLNVPYTKNLYLSALANKLNFSIDVKNDGNYISNPTEIKFYLSSNSIFDVNDYYIGSSPIESIKPDFKNHKSLEFNLPNNLTSYNYLVYVIDDNNLNIETNELNNTGSWELGLNGISIFPYFENFDGSVINGWKGYSYADFDSNILDFYRVVNKIPVSIQDNFYNREYNGVLRTERVPYGSWQSFLTPMFYIQSPTFDFSNYNSTDPLIMAFDIMSIGSNNTNGTNMEYSLDGGNNWNLLTTANGQSFNWYNYNMSDFNEPGWFGFNSEILSVKKDITFLINQNNVIFRFKHYSNSALASNAPMGFRLDNFSIGQESIVSTLNCTQNVPYYTTFDNINCWEFGTDPDSIILQRSLSSNDIEWEISTNFANQLNNSSVKIDLNGEGNTNGVWFISPKFNMITGNNLQFNIALNETGTNNSTNLGADDVVKLMYTENNGLSWITLTTWNNNSEISNTNQTVQINSLPTTGYCQFAFWATNGILNNQNTTFYVDNFQLYTGTLSNNNFKENDFNYYPNPSNDFLTIDSKKENITFINIYSISGNLIDKIHINNIVAKIDLKNYSSGFYIFEINTNNNRNFIKVLKN